jgi:hypothetical protein
MITHDRAHATSRRALPLRATADGRQGMQEFLVGPGSTSFDAASKTGQRGARG